MKIQNALGSKKRPLALCTLAAMILGHFRGLEIIDFSSRQLSLAFPSFNRLELAHAIDELIAKQLMKQKGLDDHATYALTDHGREDRIVVA